MRRAFIGALLVGFSVAVFAQTTTPQPPPNYGSAAYKTATSVTTAATLTLVPLQSDHYIYIHQIDISNCAGASAVTAAAPTTVTTTNIDGGLAFQVGSGVTAGVCTSHVVMYPNFLRAQTAGLPVTVVLPTFATNQIIRVSVAYRSAR